MTTMRAMVLEEHGGPLVAAEVPIPQPGPGEARLRVGACAVDHFDVAVRNASRERIPSYPHILGHEIAGTVDEIGSGVANVAPGDRVASTLYLVCGECPRCLSGRETICDRFAGHIGVAVAGGYAEYVVVPARNLVPIPSSIGFPEASVLANAIGTPYHALVARMQLEAGQRVVITGAGGGVGLHAVQLADHLGASAFAIDLGQDKLDAARRSGASAVASGSAPDLGETIRAWSEGHGVDGVLELVGPATMPTTLASLRKGGRMVIVGSHTGAAWTINPGDLYRNEWEILGSRNVSAAELAEVVDLVAHGHIGPVIEGTYPLDAAEELQAAVVAGTVIGRQVLVP